LFGLLNLATAAQRDRASTKHITPKQFVQSASCILQPVICTMQPATCNTQQATSNMHHAACIVYSVVLHILGELLVEVWDRSNVCIQHRIRLLDD
jgi:hypothetical protein